LELKCRQQKAAQQTVSGKNRIINPWAGKNKLTTSTKNEGDRER